MMDLVWKILCCVLMGYLVGSINPSYIISKIHGDDIRKKGSGNAGASNALIVFGKLAGLFCAIFDVAKAAVISWLASFIFPEVPWAFVAAGAACILGHIFPFYMGFRGGKGLACLGGVILMFDWRFFLILLAVELVVVLTINYICFVPMTASFIFAVVYGIMWKDVWGALALLIVAVVIFFKHFENLKRIKEGNEARFSYLWSKDKEIARLKRNADRNAKKKANKE